jgi:secondary thiamine-phosphate synthase enzyme
MRQVDGLRSQALSETLRGENRYRRRMRYMTNKPISKLPTIQNAGSSGLSQASHTLFIRTEGAGFCEITAAVHGWLDAIRARQGLLTLFIAHTSASLTIQENADPDVVKDLHDALRRFAPESGGYRHSSEGPDDMPSHIKSMLTSVSLSIPVINGRSALGTWQGVYVIEHRSRAHGRKVELHFVGTCQNSAV